MHTPEPNTENQTNQTAINSQRTVCSFWNTLHFVYSVFGNLFIFIEKSGSILCTSHRSLSLSSSLSLSHTILPLQSRLFFRNQFQCFACRRFCCFFSSFHVLFYFIKLFPYVMILKAIFAFVFYSLSMFSHVYMVFFTYNDVTVKI